MQVILLSALFAVCTTVVFGGPLGDRTFKIAAADIDIASEFDAAPDFNIDQILRCPRDASGRPIGGLGTGIVPRECLTAGAVAPPGGTRNISSNPNPVAADFIPDPNYNAKSGFDTQSLMLAAHQEDIERALFEQAVQNFTIADWLEAGLNATDVALIAFMAKQEVDHKQAFANMLGTVTPQPCNYSWPFGPHNATGFLRYALFNTRLGESGTIGWIPLLDNRASGNIIIQGITTESRQELIFRQYLGLFPVPVSFETAIPQAWHWTLLSQWISSCPESNVPLSWPILPQLRILTQPRIPFNPPYITHNSTNVSSAGDLIQVGWDRPGRLQGPYGQRTTSNATNLRPTHALIVSQLNATIVPLQNVNPRARRAAFVHPYAEVFPNADHPFGIRNPIINETVFVALINNIGRNGQSLNLSFTPENLTLATQYVVAGPAFWFIS